MEIYTHDEKKRSSENDFIYRNICKRSMFRFLKLNQGVIFLNIYGIYVYIYLDTHIYIYISPDMY